MQFNTKVFTVQTCRRKRVYKIGVIKLFRWLTAKWSFNSYNVPVIFFVEISPALCSLENQNYGKSSQNTTIYYFQIHLWVQLKNYICMQFIWNRYFETSQLIFLCGHNILVIRIPFPKSLVPMFCNPHNTTNCEVSRYRFHVNCVYIFVYSSVKPNADLLSRNM